MEGVKKQMSSLSLAYICTRTHEVKASISTSLLLLPLSFTRKAKERMTGFCHQCY